MRYYLTTIRMAVIKKIRDNIVKDVGKRQLLYTVGGNINWLKYHMIQKFYFWIYTGRK